MNRRDPIPFREIHEAAVPHVEALCRRWLPDGKKTGCWWLVSAPWRRDVTPSLIVSLTTGRWSDRSTGDHGDILDLYGRLHGGTPVECARAVARVVGHEFAGDEVAA